MELAIVDTFVRPEVSKGGSRASEAAGVSFSDILDSSARQAEPAPRALEARSPERTETSARETAPKPHTEQSAAKAKADERKAQAADRTETSAKSDTAELDGEAAAPENPAETASAETSTEGAPDDDTAGVPGAATEKLGKGAAALEVLAGLLESGSTAIDPSTPKGQLVAALVVPQNVPAHAVAAGNHSIPGLAMAGAPAAPAPGSAEAGAPALPPTTSDPGASIAGTVPPASMAPSAGTPPGMISDVDMPIAGATPTTTTAVPAAPTQPTVTSTAAAPDASSPASAQTLPVDTLIAEVADLADAPELDAATTEDLETPLLSTNAGTTAGRPAIGQASSSSAFVAQVVSQEAETTGTISAGSVSAPDDTPALSAGARNADPALMDALSDDDALMAAKPADPMPMTVSESSLARETGSVEAAAATRATRPAVVPMPEQIVVRIAKAVADGVDRINVKLSPAELGHIDVRMEIGPDGRFQAVFAADRPQTVELLQRDARELARALQDAGLRADTGSLSFNLRGQGQQRQADGAAGHGGPLAAANNGVDLPDEIAPLPVYRAPGVGSGRVDIRV